MESARPLYIQITLLLVAILFVGKLFTMQVSSDVEGGTVRSFTQYPYRGLFYDRNGELLVTNEPQFDLMVVPYQAMAQEIDPSALCNLLSIDIQDFEERLGKARRYSKTRPSTFFRKLSNTEYAQVQDILVNYPGFYVEARTVRSYPDGVLANILGYTGEIDQVGLNRDTANYYRSGDYIGRAGLEAEYEMDLRGQRGVKKMRISPDGNIVGPYDNGESDTLAMPGQDLVTTIDLELQKYAEFLMDGKVGSVVAIEPATGEILAIVSAPSYDPNLLSGRAFSTNFSEIAQDTLNPLFTRPTQATYPPGSIFKIIQALVALEEGVITPYEQIYCEGNLIGDHAPPGNYNVRRGIILSSNNYFYKVFRRIIYQRKAESTFEDARIGLETWREYVSDFGLGSPMGIDFPSEKEGKIPTLKTYDDMYGVKRWRFSNIYSLSIGQGEMLMTPLQMANLAAIMANKGYFYTPHLIKEIGDTGKPRPEYLVRNETGIDSVHFPPVLEGMAGVVNGT
ncbi:MAG TPA: peptidoglycan glycosyltransferase, partial [Cytophagales bacterium]|nr:peptidoglycan glycosyltransferase [Cytophagales bacterium]